MKCVADTSAISWLGRADYLWLLKEIYEGVYSPQVVFDQLKSHKQAKEFVENELEKIVLSEEGEKKFKLLSDKWQTWTGTKDRGDIEVFVTHHFFLYVDEMLFANKDAERKFKKYGKVRDISSLYELAEARGVFTKDDSQKFLESFLELNPPYRPDVIKKHLEGLI